MNPRTPTVVRRWGAAVEDLPAELRRKLARVRMVAFDFDGVMTDNRVYVDDTGRESVACSRFEGLGLDQLRALGISLCVISTEKNAVVSKRAEKLRLEVEQGVSDKVAMLRKLADRFGVALDDCVFVGNDVNDIPALEAAGTAFVVGDAHPAVLPYADYVTERHGGNGAVREICDLIADIQSARARGE